MLDSILSPTEIIRPTPYTMKKEYEHLKEEPREIYLSSAYFKSSWMWDLIKQAVRDSYTNKAVLFATDYALTLKGLSSIIVILYKKYSVKSVKSNLIIKEEILWIKSYKYKTGKDFIINMTIPSQATES